MLSSTAASGANASVSSSWKEDASQTIVARSSSSPTRPLSAVPTLPATATGRPASRWMCPIHSTVVVLPLVPVTAMNSLGSRRHASSSSPSTGSPRARAAAITGACAGTPGLLTTAPARSKQREAVVVQVQLDPPRRAAPALPAARPRPRRSPAPRARAADAPPPPPSGRGRRSDRGLRGSGDGGSCHSHGNAWTAATTTKGPHESQKHPSYAVRDAPT